MSDRQPDDAVAGARLLVAYVSEDDKLDHVRDAAVSEVKRSPVSCIPSPESPAKRMITRSS